MTFTVLTGEALRGKLGRVELEDPCLHCKHYQPCGCEWDRVHRLANEHIEEIAQRQEAALAAWRSGT